MKSFVAVLALVAVAAADVSHLGEASAQVLRSDSDVSTDGFSYSYETSNGISGQAQGVVKNIGQENPALEVQGSNQHTAPDGTPFQISYIANENGYQPQGAHLPTPPPPQAIPDYIVRSLQYIEAHPQKPEAFQQAAYQAPQQSFKAAVSSLARG